MNFLRKKYFFRCFLKDVSAVQVELDAHSTREGEGFGLLSDCSSGYMNWHELR